MERLPLLYCGVMIALLRLGGISLVSMHFFQNNVKGIARDVLQFSRKRDGKSSGPDAEVGDSSLMAVIISVSLKEMSVMVCISGGDS